MAGMVKRAAGVLLVAYAAGSYAQSYDFQISNIKVQGVQRLEPGTVLTYLPVSVGDRMSESRAQQSIRALYDSGLFENVALDRQGSTLVVNVTERPEIASFKIEGNKAIGGDQLKKALKQQGLAKGELYKRSLLDSLQQELRRQYYSNGYYSVKIDTDVKDLGNNRVSIDIKVTEGPIASIKDINIIGNHEFSDEQLKDVFNLKSHSAFYTHPLTFWKHPDRYSREKLVGDLESLNSYYQNRGYVRFNVSSVQVSLSPDKKNVFITINVDEGSQYKIKDVKFAGSMIVPQASLARLVTVDDDETFSRQKVQTSADNISSGLADFGYAFASVDPLTRIDDDNKTVDLTFFIDPGKRTYVNQIVFNGNEKTNDQTLRREMRQFEGAPYSRRAIQRSRTRLARLPFMQDVKVNTKKVPGTDDLVNVDYDVSERAAGQINAGVGYSDSEGFLINGGVKHTNFRGTGNTIQVNAQTNDYAKSVSASYTNPYFTPEGVSRTISGFYRKTDQLIRTGSSFDLNSVGGAVTFNFPITEYTTFRAGLGAENNKITTAVNRNGDQVVSDQVADFIRENGRSATTYELRTGFDRDTRNRTFFATRGSQTQLLFNIKGPGSDLEYYKASLEHERYLRVGSWVPKLSDKVVLQLDGRVGQTAIWGKGSDVPPYDNFFGGGAQSVRGFENGGLGPQDSYDNPFGGQFLTTLQTDLVIPTFLDSDNKTTRFSLFYDMGNVYDRASDFDVSKLGKSAGVAFDWFTPFFGLLRVSYAAYVDKSRPTDETNRFQFSFGANF
ncbi:outer membrane protein assembly factor BamA [Salinisphaera sp. Q1T1-3]|uniref:outer membrane protein assembly factor BamA n=1 Tax=Salinisphaera sp. Q1T1-3 TaxID=2321229 RepID=UPI000E751AAD|nr:outer membrane protein assembly factor BamA [Salinisphaera sp. Q1T1-3]RJS95334.1 outer membrane protein assembly factor BamA [Salinisphaera sp. Q1T1-3]